MLRITIITLLALFPGALFAAETLPVRAGEHGDYSRIVIPSAPADWRIATSERKLEIALPSKQYEFELSDILEKRKAHRVLSARVVDGADTRSLVLTLTCDCPVRTSKGDKGSIVVDIFNESPTPLTPELEDNGPTAAMQQAASQPAAQNSSTPESMRAARDRMIALLAEARHQGVVQLKIDEQKDETDDRSDEQPAAPAAVESSQASHSAPQYDPAPEHDAPLTHETRLDPPTVATAQTEEAAVCIDPSLFDEPLSEEGKLDYSTISKLRQRLETSMDEEERQDLARTLALAYIHIGFFEEARAIAAPRATHGDHNMAVAAALSDLAIGAKRNAREIMQAYAKCGPFFEMAIAAASTADDDGAPTIADAHLNALKALTSPLRAPISEALALTALERGDETLARVAYAIAKETRGDAPSAALVILEKALGAPGKDAAIEIEEKLTEAAQTPGPHQSKALALLAEDYQDRAEAAYDGFLDDLAHQTRARDMSVSEARASFSGAKALASAGRLNEGVAVLSASAQSAPKAASAAQAVARSMIIDALLGDDETRLKAIQSFLLHRDFLGGEDGAEVSLAVARELSKFGAKYLVEDALSDLPASRSAEINLIKAQTALNSDEPEAALETIAHIQNKNEAAVLKVTALERLGDSDGAVSVVKTAVQSGETSDAMTRAAWRAQDLRLAIDAFEKTPATERSAGVAARISLAALGAGLKSLPATARDVLSNDSETLAALTHMFAAAPAVNLRAIDVLADYSTGVAKETNFMQKGLGDE